MFMLGIITHYVLSEHSTHHLSGVSMPNRIRHAAVSLLTFTVWVHKSFYVPALLQGLKAPEIYMSLLLL